MIVYLLKVNLALVLFYAGYHFILQRYTFHTINRFYLLVSLVYSAVYPLIDLSTILNRNEQLKEKIGMIAPDWQSLMTLAARQSENGAGNYWEIALMVFWTGFIIMFLRLLIQLASLLTLHFQSTTFTLGSFKFRSIPKAVNPFSFWRTIYLNPECHKASELQSILEHEQVHVKQLHTVDVMLAEISTIFYWFNPGVWLIKKAIKANLEFVTDQEVIRSGINSKEYQYTLLKTQVLPQNQLPVNNFHFLTIKKRIAMINKKPSQRIKLSNYFLLLPAIMLLVLITGISKADFAGKGVVEAITHLPVLPLTQVFTNDTEASQSVTSGIKEQKIPVIAHIFDTIKKDTLKISHFKMNGEGAIVEIRVSKTPNPSLAPQTLYVVDGQLMISGVPNLNPNDIESVNIKSEGSKFKYGEAGKNGVIEIRTKSAVAPQPGDGLKAEINNEELNQNISLKTINKELIILDSKEITKSDLDQLKVGSISTMKFLKGTAAVNIYGEKGINGVIIITTKQ